MSSPVTTARALRRTRCTPVAARSRGCLSLPTAPTRAVVRCWRWCARRWPAGLVRCGCGTSTPPRAIGGAWPRTWRRCSTQSVALLIESPGPGSGAGDGVHLGAADLWPGGASQAAVGRSCHSDQELSRASAEGCQWATLSPIYPSGSKPGYGPPLGPAALAGPRCRLGRLAGSTRRTQRNASSRGAAGVAVMGAVLRSPDPAAAVARIQDTPRRGAAMTPPVALTIAGSDSGGGAGMQADLRTFAALGVFGTTAITCVTAQNTAHVNAVHVLPAAFVRAQIEAVIEDMTVSGAKTGVLYSEEIVQRGGRARTEPARAGRRPGPGRLHRAASYRRRRGPCLPGSAAAGRRRCHPEPSRSKRAAGRRSSRPSTMRAEAARRLGDLAPVVVVKGGHGNDPSVSVDVVWDGQTLLGNNPAEDRYDQHARRGLYFFGCDRRRPGAAPLGKRRDRAREHLCSPSNSGQCQLAPRRRGRASRPFWMEGRGEMTTISLGTARRKGFQAWPGRCGGAVPGGRHRRRSWSRLPLRHKRPFARWPADRAYRRSARDG